MFDLLPLHFKLGKGSKTRVTGLVRKGGRGTPLPANFFSTPLAA